jgi:hypothetical protein
MAAADFDEDGVPDLVSTFGSEGRGVLTLHGGNVDAIYPHTAEAQERRARGAYTDSPFLTPARIFPLSLRPDFVGAGDFDADDHQDLVLAERGSEFLLLLSGDGYGGFVPARRITLTGAVTAMAIGEINRRDGLADVVVGITGDDGSYLLVFEGPGGALIGKPESI